MFAPIVHRVTMYRAVVLVLLVVGASADRGGKGACRKLHPGLMHCCTKMSAGPPMRPEEELKECFVKPKPPPSCDIEECIAKKLGYYGADGKIDKDAFASYIETKFEDDQDFLGLIKENCLDSDISDYGPPDMCDFMKMKHCFHRQFVENCPEWSDEGECKGIAEIVKECSAA